MIGQRGVHQIDLWLWRLDDCDPSLLAEDERARAERFVFDRDRVRYIAARARLRRILGGYLDCAPESLRFAYGTAGKPALPGISFNLSHCGDLAALAVCADAVPLGVDIEAVRPVEESVARLFFAAGERAALQALPEAEWLLAFHRCWTRKEAYVKALGTGLGADTRSFEVSIGHEAALLWCATGDAGRWSVRDIALPPGFVGAVAACSDGAPLSIVRRG
jgi:4'-phosphopantetheinyl transferase